MVKILLAVGAFLVTVALMSVASLYMNLFDQPALVTITLADGHNHESTADVLKDVLDWTDEEYTRFVEAITGIKWDRFNQPLVEYLSQKLSWDEADREIFLTRSSLLLASDDRIIEAIYIPGQYKLDTNLEPAQVAEALVERVIKDNDSLESFFETRLSSPILQGIQDFIANQKRLDLELTPDLVPLPPQDVSIKESDGRTLLVFSTTYYNIGEGNLELVADSETAGVADDIERRVFQRIYRTDDTHRDRYAGTFLWHQSHLHYHFADFIEYRLEPEGRGSGADQPLQQKSTFCIRDVSKIQSLDLPNDDEADYLICGKEKQGVSVGWGDTYFHTYADQNLDITDISSGTYILRFTLNPNDRFEEVTKSNNVSWAKIDIDKQAGTVKVIDTEPKEIPEYEHIYVEQVF